LTDAVARDGSTARSGPLSPHRRSERSSADLAASELFDAAFRASLSRLRFAVLRLRAREGEGHVRADRRGGRVEFAGHRPYAPGDDMRHLDWAVYRRTGRLYVKQYEREDELSVLLLVDASGSMETGGKARAAARLAYALAYLALSDGSRVRVALSASGGARLSGEVSGVPRIAALGRFLAASGSGGGTDLGASLRSLPRARRGSRVLVLISDLLTEHRGQSELAARAQQGDEINVLHLIAREDRAEGAHGVTVLEDAETGERIVVRAGADAVAWDTLRRIEEDWRGFCPLHGLRYVPLDAAESIEEMVITWLRLGGVLA